MPRVARSCRVADVCTATTGLLVSVGLDTENAYRGRRMCDSIPFCGSIEGILTYVPTVADEPTVRRGGSQSAHEPLLHGTSVMRPTVYCAGHDGA